MSTYFSADARSLIKSMLETDPKKRIKVYNAEIIHVMTGTLFINSVSLKMDDVIRHPWFTKETHYTLPMNIPELPCQYNESIELERNTLNIMKTLLDCNMSKPMTICKQALLECLDFKSPASALSSSSTLCDNNNPIVNKAFEAADKVVQSNSGTIEGDEYTISHCPHDISSASKPDGVSLIANESLNEEVRYDFEY
ncbi:hypothetical protein VKS41_006819 [Umbelopsis sp. WA50703]